MKKVFLLLSILVFISNVKAQEIYYDALTLKKECAVTVIAVPGPNQGKLEMRFTTETDTTKVLEILGRYIPKEVIETYNRAKPEDKKDLFKKALGENPFLMLPAMVHDKRTASLTENASKAFSKLAGIDVTNYADALAQFMVERAKEELNIAFFQKFKKYLDKNPEIATLFPKTSEYISNMMAHEYAQLLNGLRDVFQEDLKNLLYQLDDVFLLPRYQQVVTEFPEILVVIRSVQIVTDLEDGQHPADIIRQFNTMKEWQRIDRFRVKNLHNFIKTTSLVSEALRFKADALDLLEVEGEGKIKQTATDLTADHDGRTITLKSWTGDRNWITVRHFEMLFKDEIATKLFLALVYQRAAIDNIVFHKSQNDVISLTSVMKNNATSIFAFRSYFLDFLRLAEQTEQKLTELKGKQGKLEPGDYYEYVSSAIDIIEYGFRITNLIDEKFDGTEYVKVMRSGNNLYRNIVDKNYSAAVTNALYIIQIVTEVITEQSEYDDVLKKSIARDAANFSTEPEKEKMETEYTTGFENFKTLNKLSKGAVKYGVFMANVVDAKSSAEIKEAIENAALPAGSSSYKKYQRATLSVSSYLGGQLRLKHQKDPKRTWDQNLGVIAPVGLALNWGIGKYGAVSIFAPLIDVGAIAEFRLKDNGTELTESIKLGNIFSPGGYLVYGFGGNIPLALGIGAQYGPGLFEVKGASNGSTTNAYQNPEWRANVFLAIDMPLFNLTPGKKIKCKKLY